MDSTELNMDVMAWRQRLPRHHRHREDPVEKAEPLPTASVIVHSGRLTIIHVMEIDWSPVSDDLFHVVFVYGARCVEPALV